MTSTADLSLDQAPPLSVPFRFFLTAPLFGVGAGLLSVWAGPELVASRWLPTTLAFTHLLTLGFLSLIMVGALFQVLPVLAGSPVPGAFRVGVSVHLALTAGVATIVPGFLSPDPRFMLCAVLLLCSGFFLFLVVIGVALVRAPAINATTTAIRCAVLALAVTVSLGTLLSLGRSGVTPLWPAGPITDLHLGWGIMGWTGLLVVGVAYQAIPMFQMTPEYPQLMQRLLAPAAAAALAAHTLVASISGASPSGAVAADLILSLPLLLLAVFAVTTIALQSRRKRRLPDVTLAFWQLGLGAVVVAALLWLAARWVEVLGQSPTYPLALGGLALVAAGVSLTNGMLYRIVPFLCWFHLQHRQIVRGIFTPSVPHMKCFVPDAAARRQYRSHLAACLCGGAGLLLPDPFLALFGGMLVVSNALLLANLVGAVRQYRRAFREIEAAAGGRA